MEIQNASFREVLRAGEVAIGYEPFPSEPRLEFEAPPVGFTISSDKSIDPVKTAEEVAAVFAGKQVCVYIPGTAFDVRGTRHGRGGGWYDRFLAAVPSEWLRIGICFEHNFSDVSLTREAWDQPVDWVCVQKENGREYYETNARIL